MMALISSRRKTLAWATVALALLQPASAFCWGPVGHETVAIMAEDMVSPQTQAALGQILGGVSLDQIANCADQLRDAGTDCAGLFDPPLQADKMTDPWHFVNIPLSAEVSQTPATPAIDQYKDCDEAAGGPTAAAMQDSMEDCVRGQVQFAVQTLRAPAPELPAGTPSEQAQAASVLRRRRMAIMYLVHLEADAHQPLHVTNNNDAGGNEDQVVFQGRSQNLHHVWDGVIGAQNAMNAQALAELLKKDLSTLPQSEIDGWTQGELDAVINAGIGEGFNIAKNTIYPDYFAAKAANPGARAVPLGDDYQSKMQPVAYRRLEQAAVRLAFLLDQSLGQNPDFAQSSEKSAAMAGAWRKHGKLNLKKPDLSGTTWDGRAPVLPKN